MRETDRRLGGLFWVGRDVFVFLLRREVEEVR